MEKETERGNGIQEAKSSILFISTRICKGLWFTANPFFIFTVDGVCICRQRLCRPTGDDKQGGAVFF